MFSRVIRPVRASSLQFVRFQSSSVYKDALALLKTDLKKAMLAKDTLKGLMSGIKNKEIDTKPANHNEFLLFELYNKFINQRNESVKEYQDNKRDDLVEKELKEIEIIKSYIDQLPVASIEEIETKVTDLIKGLQSEGKAKNIGEIMKSVDWKVVETEWKASQSSVRTAIAKIHRSLTQ
ncbi:hypothetical protein BN7_717 [Wickerhamomyces ciferrii]|uniref:Altered inheritance of mitochondria protein 41 n=1 Tax=Wickerhamomyces ciferrii (strain ATCC 14091 / BCRC 22168 / CBS 111 / JCM 3599 / NBRC 0793 / NRRL Y-1031 F-60-10) TaxID=1206466 RepID=K0K8L7_WICCF|nr:uncharacterized protein BN7_717 [Wickerhamomyces ciferrii]CCH41180.1 hypothetical protein BN7_717 [Wickerhamomyces ciferrii]